MNTIQKQARHDAREYARAKMFYGEGAGNRRKIIEAVVEAKGARSPRYAHEFHRELAKQDWAEHAAKARRERKRKDVGHALSMNSRGLVSGNYANVNTAVLIIAVGAYFAHKNGLDAKAYEGAKSKLQSFRDKRAKRKNKKVHPITTPPPPQPREATIHPHPTVFRAH